MKFTTALTFATWVFATGDTGDTGDTGYGTLHISLIGNEKIHRNLLVKKNMIFANDHFSVFNYDGNKTIKLSRSTKFLNVSKNGLLIMIPGSSSDFHVDEEPNLGKIRKVSYQEDEVFDICSDNLIRYNSSCEGAKKVLMFYVDLAEFH